MFGSNLGGAGDPAPEVPAFTGCRELDLAGLRVFYDSRGESVSDSFLERIYELMAKRRGRAASPPMSTNPLFETGRPRMNLADEFMAGLNSPRASS